MYSKRVSSLLLYDTRKCGLLSTAVHVRSSETSVELSTPIRPPRESASLLILGDIALLIAVDVVGCPEAGAMRQIATCCGRYVDAGSQPVVSTCLALLALRCCWSYTDPSKSVVHDRGQPGLSETGAEE
jgi:hypothetical protein